MTPRNNGFAAVLKRLFMYFIGAIINGLGQGAIRSYALGYTGTV